MRRALPLLALALATCAAPDVRPSGFLRNYEHLEPTGRGTVSYRAPGLDLWRYERVLIEPVQLVDLSGSGFGGLRADQLEALRSGLREALRDALLPAYAVVKSPGPRVMQLRVSLTRGGSGPVPPAVRGEPWRLAGLDLELELVDSLTAERLAARVDMTARGSRLGGPRAARVVFRAWARDARAWLDGLGGS